MSNKSLVADHPTSLHLVKLGGFMFLYDAVALNRDQKKPLTQKSTIEHARDACHDHARSAQLPPIVWATGYYGLVGLTQDGPSPLTPFQVRYTIEVNNDAS